MPLKFSPLSKEAQRLASQNVQHI